MLNVAAVPVLTITLRNNLMQVLPIKRWLKGCDCGVARFLLQVSIIFAKICLGQPKDGKRSLVSNCEHSCHCDCVFYLESASNRDLHWRHMWNVHFVYYSNISNSLCQRKAQKIGHAVLRVRKPERELVLRPRVVNFHLHFLVYHAVQRHLGHI
jgi:hypothetical protein